MMIPDPRNDPDPDRDLADSVQFVSVERGGQWIRDYRERCEAEARADERAKVLAAVLAEMESMYHPDEAAETMAAIEERLEVSGA
jgi:hypothetical protein